MKYRYTPDLASATYDAIVIGSGIGGLTSAILLAKAGKKVLVLEQHYEPGGFTHTFKRKNFVWDVGVHYVGQVNIENSLLKKAFDYLSCGKLKWADMGDIYDQAVFGKDVYNFRSGYEKQVQQLIEYFPGEAEGIKAYFKLLRNISGKSAMYFGERTMPPWLSRTVGYFLRKGFLEYAHRTTHEVISGFTSNQKLISLLCAQCGNYGLPPKKSCFGIHAMIVDHFLEGGNYPVGGAASIHRTFTDNLLANGGRMAIKAPVRKILIENHTAIGVEMENGDCIYAKRIISNAGVHNTFQRLVEPGEMDVSGWDSVAPSISHVCLYVGLSASDDALQLPKHNIWKYEDYNFDERFDEHNSKEYNRSPIIYISFPSAKDPSWQSVHPGTAAIQVVGSFPYKAIKHWEQSRWQKRDAEYNFLKEDLKKFLLDKLLEHVPQVRDKIAWAEVSTPLSTRHFSGYQSGEIYGLEHSPARFDIDNLRPRTKIKNLYLTGQDIVCCGVGAALFSGIITATSVLNRNVLWNIIRYKEPSEKLPAA